MSRINVDCRNTPQRLGSLQAFDILARPAGFEPATPWFEVLKSPHRCPKANAICERVIGRIRRECLDWLIPLSEAHLCLILKTWVAHCNGGRPHSRQGPHVPDPPTVFFNLPPSQFRPFLRV